MNQSPTVTIRIPRTSWPGAIMAGLLHSAAFALAYPPYDYWPLIYVALIPLALLALRATDRRRAVIGVWIAGVPVWLWMQRWLIDVTLPGYILLSLFQPVFAALFVWLLSVLRGRSHGVRGQGSGVREKASRPQGIEASSVTPSPPHLLTPSSSRPVVPGLVNTILVPLLWVGIEMLRGAVLFGGYPWFLLGHPLVNVPVLAQTADLFGTYFVSFTAAMFAGLVADLLTLPLVTRRQPTQGAPATSAAFSLSPGIRLALMSFVIVQTFVLTYGIWRTGQTPSVQTGRTITAAAIQTNLPQDNKIDWPLEERFVDFERFVALTEQAADGEPRADFIVWPETMAPGLSLNPDAIRQIRRVEPQLAYFHDRLSTLTRETGIPLLVGSDERIGLRYETTPEGTFREYDRRYNSALLYDAQGRQSPQRYDKIHLTPFGEVIPYLHRWPALQQWVLNIGARGMSFTLSAGREFARIEIPLERERNREAASGFEESILVATPICFESTMPNICRRLVAPRGERKADLLVNLTNDGWFGSVRGGREQHFQIGRFRAIENRVPMIRAANTGISGAIDSAGRIVQPGPNEPAVLSPDRSEGIMRATVALDGRRTLYMRIGDAFGWLCLAAAGVLMLAGIARRRNGPNDKD